MLRIINFKLENKDCEPDSTKETPATFFLKIFLVGDGLVREERMKHFFQVQGPPAFDPPDQGLTRVQEHFLNVGRFGMFTCTYFLGQKYKVN